MIYFPICPTCEYGTLILAPKEKLDDPIKVYCQECHTMISLCGGSCKESTVQVKYVGR